MPTFILYTNISSDKISSGFLTETSKLVAEGLGKPESYVTVRVHGGINMIHGGKNEACGSAELQSIGKLGVEENIVLSNKIAEHLESCLGIKADRCYIRFTDIPPAELGYNKTTFHAIFKNR